MSYCDALTYKFKSTPSENRQEPCSVFEALLATLITAKGEWNVIPTHPQVFGGLAPTLSTSINNEEGEVEKMIDNTNKIEKYRNLPRGWNGYNAKPIPRNVCRDVGVLIQRLQVQPVVRPTGRRSIQFEYTNQNGEYLEFEFMPDGTMWYLLERKDGNMLENRYATYDVEAIKNIIGEFYKHEHNFTLRKS